MKLIQMCPDPFIDIIDHFLDGLPSDLPANFVKENSLLKWVIFYHHGSRPEINESHYKIRWLYFMHRLKGKTDLDPIRQSIHDAMIESMNKEIKPSMDGLALLKVFFIMACNRINTFKGGSTTLR